MPVSPTPARLSPPEATHGGLATATSSQPLEQERQKVAAFAQELSAAQREIAGQAAQLRKAGEEAGQLRQADAAKAAQALEQERQKAAALAQELSAARREAAAQAAQLRKVGEDVGQLRQADAARVSQSQEQERQRAAAIAQASAARQAVLASRQALAQAEARVDQAATTLARARIARDEAQRRLDDTVIRASFDGTLAEVSVIEGRLVSANEQLARLIDPSSLEVAFRVSTQSYARLLDADGQLRAAPVTAVLDVFGTDLTATGTLNRAGAAVGEGQTGRLLFARLDAAPGFRPGDFVSVEIEETPLENVARLPATALSPSGEVLVLNDDERLETVAVELLRRQGDDVLVAGDAVAGLSVVAERTPLLGAGIKVRPLRTTPQAAQAPPDMLELSDERRQRLVAFVEASERMPAEAKSRILAQLGQPSVPADVVQRIEARIGG